MLLRGTHHAGIKQKTAVRCEPVAAVCGLDPVRPPAVNGKYYAGFMKGRQRRKGRADGVPSAAPERLHQRVLVGEDPGRFLGIDQPAVDRDLEDSAARLQQRDPRREGILEFRRQTGGVFAITSLIAEFDRDLHAAPPKNRVVPQGVKAHF